jgi:hypothetical protein
MVDQKLVVLRDHITLTLQGLLKSATRSKLLWNSLVRCYAIKYHLSIPWVSLVPSPQFLLSQIWSNFMRILGISRLWTSSLVPL